jgi:hypothetical protein
MYERQGTLGELLVGLELTNDDYSDLIVDFVYDDLVEVKSVYSWVGLRQEESNMVQVFNQPPVQPKSRIEQLRETLRERLKRKAGDIFEHDWTQFIDHLPCNSRTKESYLSHNVPKSLRDIVQGKLEPLNERLSQDRQILEERDNGSKVKSFQQAFDRYVAIPVISLSYFLVSGESPEIIRIDSGNRSLENAHLELQKKLKIVFTDLIVLQYFENFQDENSMTYMGYRLRLARSFSKFETKKRTRQIIS